MDYPTADEGSADKILQFLEYFASKGFREFEVATACPFSKLDPLGKPETVLRWRREGWSVLWRYQSRGRWRGGRPRISREVRLLIARMARQNFLCEIQALKHLSYSGTFSRSLSSWLF